MNTKSKKSGHKNINEYNRIKFNGKYYRITEYFPDEYEVFAEDDPHEICIDERSTEYKNVVAKFKMGQI